MHVKRFEMHLFMSENTFILPTFACLQVDNIPGRGSLVVTAVDRKQSVTRLIIIL